MFKYIVFYEIKYNAKSYCAIIRTKKSEELKLALSVLVPKILFQNELVRYLKKIKIKKSDIKKIYYANGSTLLILKKRVKSKPPKNMIPPLSLEKEIMFVSDFCDEYKYLIEMERIAEINAQLNEIKSFTAKEREIFGRAILDLKGKKLPLKFNLHFVRFGRDRIIQTEISSGDIVLVSRGDPLKSDLTGTVSEVKKQFITVAFENPPPKWVYSYPVRVDLYVNDVTFKRMEENLEFLRHAKGRKRYLRNVAIGLVKPRPFSKESFEIVNENLNFSQREAVSSALGAEDLFLIHGPPGTGKTSTLIEVILQEVKRGKKVLATADSNTAVDNMLKRLSEYDLNLVRVGHPARIVPELEKFSVFAIYEKSEKKKSMDKGWEEVALMAKLREEHSKPSPSRARGMSRDRILTLAEKGKSQRGVSVQTMQSMAEWIKIDRKIEKMVENLKKEEERIFEDIIKKADVVLSTNSMIMSDILKNFEFDVSVIDEGSQQIAPSTLIPIMKSQRFIIAGDHKQLPPTVVSSQAFKLRNSLFEDMMERFGFLSLILRVQYRMNEKIMGFSNKMFYKGFLTAHESVKNRTLKDFSLKEPSIYGEILDPSSPLVFADTESIEALENLPDRSTSYENEKEAKLVEIFVRELVRMGVGAEDIGVISPYASQVKKIKTLLEDLEELEVKSVDGFQGREKEVIIVSFVRSNDRGEIGFLKDLRRLNVALTRAKRKLITVGNAKTLSKEKAYEEFLEYVKKEGVYTKVEYEG